jgi:hypothetical protein
VSAGNGITVSGATGAVQIASTITPNTVLNAFASDPISATAVGGSATTISTYGGLVAGSTYLFVISGGVSAAADVNTSTVSMALKFASLGENYQVATFPYNTTGVGFNSCCSIVVPAGQTSIDLIVSGFNAGGVNCSAVVYNSNIIKLN